MAHQGVMQSFPDRKVEILGLITEGDKVFVRVRVTGTNRGGFPAFRVPANDRPFDTEAWSVYRLKDGKVVEHQGMNDALSLLMQLGGDPFAVLRAGALSVNLAGRRRIAPPALPIRVGGPPGPSRRDACTGGKRGSAADRARAPRPCRTMR